MPWHAAPLAQLVENGLVHHHELAAVGHEYEVTAARELVQPPGLQLGVVVSDASFEKPEPPTGSPKGEGMEQPTPDPSEEG